VLRRQSPETIVPGVELPLHLQYIAIAFSPCVMSIHRESRVILNGEKGIE